MGKKREHDPRRLTDEDRVRHAGIGAAASKEFPPTSRRPASPPGIPLQSRRARESRGLARDAFAKLANIPNQGTLRGIQQGKDTRHSRFQAVAAAIDIKLESAKETV